MHNHQTQWITQWGGICQGRHTTLIPEGFFEDVVNFALNPDGSLGPRPGVETLIVTPDGFQPIKVFSADWDGTPLLLVSTKKHVYRYVPNNAEQMAATSQNGTFTLIHTWPSNCTRASFALINPNTTPHVVMGNGIDPMALYKSDGTTTPMSSEGVFGKAPIGLPVEYENYLAVFGIPGQPGKVQFNRTNGYIERTTSNVENYIINKSNDLYYLPSDFNHFKTDMKSAISELRDNNGNVIAAANYEVIEDNGSYFIRIRNITLPARVFVDYESVSDDPWLKDGIEIFLELQGEVTALYPFGGLMIFTDKRTELFSGDPDKAEGQRVLSATVGCAGYDSVIEAEGCVYWIAQQGICRWDGSGTFPAEILSDENAATGRASNISEDMRRINWKEREKFSAAYDNINRRLYFFVDHYIKTPLNPTLRSDIFVFELKNSSWYRWTFADRIRKVYFANVPSISQDVVMLDGRMLLSSEDDQRLLMISFDFYNEKFKDEVRVSSSAVENRNYLYFARSGAMSQGTTENDKIYRALTLKTTPNYKNYNGAHKIFVLVSGDMQTDLSDYLTTTEEITQCARAAVFRVAYNFIMGISQMGDRLTMFHCSEQRRPVAIKAKYLTFEIYGEGPGNAMPISGLGISFRTYSNRSTLTWDNDLI